MLFKEFADFDGLDFMQKINNIGINCSPKWRMAFLGVYPEQGKALKLKDLYKPNPNSPGAQTEYYNRLMGQQVLRYNARIKLEEQQFFGTHYTSPDASLKLHLNLNNIGEHDETIILNLIQFLVAEAESPKNDLSFHFKIIKPYLCSNERFQMSDQLTFYFDTYSSTGAMVRLANIIGEYLKNHVQENTLKLGPKDSFGFNSFVSARFDNNKLVERYDTYPFFDLELKTFFEKHSPEKLDNLPLGVLEAVFNTILITEEISLALKEPSQSLNDDSSKRVQEEFDKMLNDPMQYLAGVEINEKALNTAAGKVEKLGIKEEQKNNESQESKEQVDKFIMELYGQKDQIRRLFSLALSEEMNEHQNTQFIQDTYAEIEKRIKQINPTIEKFLQEIDPQITPEGKDQLRKKLEQFKVQEPKIPQTAKDNFNNALEEMNAKRVQLLNNNALNKAQAADSLYRTVKEEFFLFEKGLSQYQEFSTNCNNEITLTKDTLNKHRGWKEVLTNLWEAIKTLGRSLRSEYKKSGGNTLFFKVLTASGEIAEKMKGGIEELKEIEPGQEDSNDQDNKLENP